MTYLERFQSCNTLLDVFTLREELLKAQSESDWACTKNIKALDEFHAMNFYIERCEAVIKCAEARGVFLPQIEEFKIV